MRFLYTVFVFFSLFFVCAISTFASSQPYESSHIDRPSTKFQVKVDGQPVDVVYRDDGTSNHGDTHYAHFAQTGTARL